MKNIDLQNLIKESLQEIYDELSIDAIPLQKVDMPIQDKSVFGMEDYITKDEDDDINDLLKKFSSMSDDYEGDYEDDTPVSPGYFNEGEMDALNLAKNNNDRFELELYDYVGGKDVWDKFSKKEQEEIISDYKRLYDQSLSSMAGGSMYESTIEEDDAMSDSMIANAEIEAGEHGGSMINVDNNIQESTDKIFLNLEELELLVKEGVSNLHKKTIIENRIDDINRALNDLDNISSWENARNQAQSELEKKTLNWTSPTSRPSGILNEKKYSDAAQDFIGKEIKYLKDKKGYSQDRAVAAAINIAKDKGYKVPSNESLDFEIFSDDDNLSNNIYVYDDELDGVEKLGLDDKNVIVINRKELKPSKKKSKK